jgi:hypothetical protein
MKLSDQLQRVELNTFQNGLGYTRRLAHFPPVSKIYAMSFSIHNNHTSPIIRTGPWTINIGNEMDFALARLYSDILIL